VPARASVETQHLASPGRHYKHPFRGPAGTTPDGKQQESLGKSVTEGIKDLFGDKKKQ
jgi:hypothetical protein